MSLTPKLMWRDRRPVRKADNDAQCPLAWPRYEIGGRGEREIDEAAFKDFIRRHGVRAWSEWWEENLDAIQRMNGSYATLKELEDALMDAIAVDISGIDLSGMVLDGIRLDYAGCMDANLRGASFRGAELVCVEFSGSDLLGVDFSNADLAFAIFKNADLRGAVFNGARMSGVSLSGARAEGCDFSTAVEYSSFEEVLAGLGIDPEEIMVSQITDDNAEIKVMGGLKK